MSMFVVSNECLNDVANLIIKIYPYMDLNVVFNRLLKLNIEIWNNKYNLNNSVNDYDYKVVNYNDYVFKKDNGAVGFKPEFNKVQIVQLIESLRTYHYQIEPDYINTMNNRFTYSLLIEVYDNPLIKELRYFIEYNKLNKNYSNDDYKKIKCVEWNRY